MLPHSLRCPELNLARGAAGQPYYASLFNQIPAQRHLRKVLVPWHREPPCSLSVPILMFSQSFFPWAPEALTQSLSGSFTHREHAQPPSALLRAEGKLRQKQSGPARDQFLSHAVCKQRP